MAAFFVSRCYFFGVFYGYASSFLGSSEVGNLNRWLRHRKSFSRNIWFRNLRSFRRAPAIRRCLFSEFGEVRSRLLASQTPHFISGRLELSSQLLRVFLLVESLHPAVSLKQSLGAMIAQSEGGLARFLRCSPFAENGASAARARPAFAAKRQTGDFGS